MEIWIIVIVLSNHPSHRPHPHPRPLLWGWWCCYYTTEKTRIRLPNSLRTRFANYVFILALINNNTELYVVIIRTNFRAPENHSPLLQPPPFLPYYNILLLIPNVKQPPLSLHPWNGMFCFSCWLSPTPPFLTIRWWSQVVFQFILWLRPRWVKA